MANLAGGDGGGTDDGSDGSFPYGPADPPSGYGQPSTPPSSYDPGPAPYQSYYHASPSKPSAQTSSDVWSGISPGAHDQAVQLADTFGATLGWPDGWDVNKWALALAKSGVNVSSAFDAYEWLFNNAISADQRQASPWARFGMTKDAYNSKVQAMNSVMATWTGSSLSPDDLANAIKNSWTPTEIQNFATFGNPEGTGPMLAQAQMSGSMPWLGLGQTYQQTLQGFQSFEDHAPDSTATLAAWFRFGQSAKQLGGGGEAIGSASSQIQRAGSTVR